MGGGGRGKHSLVGQAISCHWERGFSDDLTEVRGRPVFLLGLYLRTDDAGLSAGRWEVVWGGIETTCDPCLD